QERKPAERGVAELHQGAARKLVQDRAVAWRVQKMGLVQLRRLVGHRRGHLPANVAEQFDQGIDVLDLPFLAAGKGKPCARLALVEPSDHHLEHALLRCGGLQWRKSLLPEGLRRCWHSGCSDSRKWRRERDSNPRYAVNVYTLSKRAP